MSLVLNVEILGEFKKLTEATKGSEKSLGSLDDQAKKISKGINTALGAIGVGFSLNFLIDQFKESTKAAIEDQKSKVLLTEALKQNLNATEQQVDAVEQYISKTQLATSITDDSLRPAFAKLAIATKDTDEAMKLMTVATDVAAGTGKNLDAVVQAMSRALAGNETALFRLVPSIKGADDPMKALAETFAGAAEAAANTDPYARMQIIFGELQEEIGMALLPYLEQFSAWLASPGGQEQIRAIVDTIIDMIENFKLVIDQVMKYKELITATVIVLGGLTTAIKLATLAQAAFTLALSAPQFLAAAAVVGFLAAAYLTLTGQIEQAARAQASFNSSVSGSSFSGFTSGEAAFNQRYGIGTKSTTTSGTTNVNVNINRAQVNADDVAKALNDKLKSQGSALRIQ
jgi:hypothetical protein